MENPTFVPLKLDPFNNGNLLEGLFIYQGSLVLQYIEKGKLPKKTFDWHSRDYQTFLKKTISNLLEEMAETNMEQDKIAHIMANNVYHEAEHQIQMIKHARDAGVEFADALHFFIELLIYSGIGPEEVREYYKELSRGNNLGALAGEEGLQSAFAFARHLNIHEDDVREFKYLSFVLASISAESLDTPFKYVHPGLFKAIERLYWKVSKTLLKAQNTLKLREWRSSEETTLSVQAYQEMLMEAFTFFMQIADAMSMSTNMVYCLYENKNFIVQKRLADGY